VPKHHAIKVYNDCTVCSPSMWWRWVVIITLLSLFFMWEEDLKCNFNLLAT
jgi:hypothetical protein